MSKTDDKYNTENGHEMKVMDRRIRLAGEK
jgi:hypothetical protein